MSLNIENVLSLHTICLGNGTLLTLNILRKPISFKTSVHEYGSHLPGFFFISALGTINLAWSLRKVSK